MKMDMMQVQEHQRSIQRDHLREENFEIQIL